MFPFPCQLRLSLSSVKFLMLLDQNVSKEDTVPVRSISQDTLTWQKDGAVTVVKELSYCSIIGEDSVERGVEGEIPEPEEHIMKDRELKKINSSTLPRGNYSATS